MNAGALDHRLRFERATHPLPQTGSGATVPDCQPAYECWARVLPATGSEQYRNQAIQARSDVTIWIRDPGETFSVHPGEGLRIVDLSDRQRVYDISAVERADEGRRRWLRIAAWSRAEREAAA